MFDASFWWDKLGYGILSVLANLIKSGLKPLGDVSKQNQTGNYSLRVKFWGEF